MHEAVIKRSNTTIISLSLLAFIIAAYFFVKFVIEERVTLNEITSLLLVIGLSIILLIYEYKNRIIIKISKHGLYHRTLSNEVIEWEKIIAVTYYNQKYISSKFEELSITISPETARQKLIVRSSSQKSTYKKQNNIEINLPLTQIVTFNSDNSLYFQSKKEKEVLRKLFEVISYYKIIDLDNCKNETI